MPFLVDSVMGEIQDFGAAIRLVAHPVVTVRRERRGKLSGFFPLPRAPTGAPRKPHADSHRPPRRRGGRRDAGGPPRFRCLRSSSRRPRLAGDARAGGAAIAAYRSNRRRSEGEVEEAIAFLEWLLDDNFTLLGMREYEFAGGGRTASCSAAPVEPRHPARSDVRVLRRGGEPVTMTPGIRAFLCSPKPLIITKANIKSRVHRRVYMDYVGVKDYGRGKLVGELRIVGLFTSTAYTRSARVIPFLRRKVGRVIARAGYDPDGHSGKALVNVLEILSARRAVPDRRGPALHIRARPSWRSRSGRGCACWSGRDKFDRFVSIIVFVPRDRYDSDVRQRIGEYLAEVFEGHVSAFYPAFPGSDGARPRPFHHRPLGRQDAVARPGGRSRRGSRPSCGRGPTTLRRRLAGDGAGSRGIELARRYDDAFPGGLPRRLPPSSRARRHRGLRGAQRARAVGGAFPRAARDSAEPVGLTLIHRGAPIALSERVPMLENIGFRVIDERSYEIAAADWRAPHSRARYGAGGRRRRAGRSRRACQRRADGCLLAVWDRQAESDGYNALVLTAGLAGARRRCCAPCRATCGRPARPRAALHGRRPERASGRSRGSSCASSARASTPTHRDDDTATPALGAISRPRWRTSTASTRTASCAASSTWSRRWCAPTSSSDAAGGPPAEIAFKLDSQQDRGPAGAAAVPRDLRPCAARRRRPPALRQGCPRRHPLVRPAAGFPHRDPRARQGPAGQERRHRAGRRQGRLRAEMPAGGRQPRRDPGRRAPRPTASSSTACSTSPTTSTARPSCRRPTSFATTRRPLSGGRRRQGHGDLLRYRQRHRRSSTASGWAMPSPAAAPPATTTRRWASPRAAPGKRSSAISARSTSTSRRRRSPWSASATCRATCSATACCCRRQTRLVAAFDHRDIFIDPDPDPAASLAERQRLFALPRSSWQDYDRDKISAGGGVFSRREKSIPLSPRSQALLGIPRRAPRRTR